MNKLSVVAAALVLGACAATPTTTIHESAGRVTLAESHIGEAYDVVMARATTQFEKAPHCEARKISLRKQRKAFSYNVCGFKPDGQKFANAPLSEVVYHFIEQKLVRVDVRAEGQAALLDKVKDDMQAVFAARGAKPSELNSDSFEWVGRQQVAGVRSGAGASTGNVHVRLLDESLKDKAPWLAAE